MSFFNLHTILWHIPIGKGGYNLSYIEAVGTIFGLLCIWFASKEKTINYFFGIINVILFGIIFFQLQLYASLFLQIFFLLANIYGWYAWTRPANASLQQNALEIHWLPKKNLFIILFIVIALIILLTCSIDVVFGFLAKIATLILNRFGANLPFHYLPDSSPILDSSVTVLSLVAQVMMTRKLVENWILWVVIDLLSIFLYIQQGVYFMAIEYMILCLICINGAYLWIKSAAKTTNV